MIFICRQKNTLPPLHEMNEIYSRETAFEILSIQLYGRLIGNLQAGSLKVAS